MFRPLDVLLAMTLLGACASALAADRGLLDGDLGRWLDTEAAPQLLDTLDRHPRFRGETLRIVPMRNGEPISTTDRLNLAIQRALEHRLLQSTGVRIATQGNPRRCDLRTDVPYLLGVEVGGDGPSRHRVHLAIADVEEGIWVNGASKTWSGRLTTAQRGALRERISIAQPGTLGNPLSIRDAVAVANTLYAQLTCDLRSVPTHEVRLVSDEQQLDGVKRHMDTRLRASTELRSIATTRESAWTLRIRSTATLEAQRDVILELEDPSGVRPTQRLASVTVTGFGPAQTPLDEPDGHSWLSNLRHQNVPTQGVCMGRPDATCTEVTLDLYQPVYLLVFHTRGTRIDVPACGRTPKRRAGERRFRFAVASTGHHNAVADGGFYALATDRSGVARALHRHLAEAPGACRGKRNVAAIDTWLAKLDLLLTQHSGAIQWRAIHLRHDTDQVVSL
ncbi:MAG: hypothetical protein E2O54_01675 [Gammaproteobacteria bacterium]|nr:MAG: hypothetical protein E2O58_03135 [Gammaproteobacteria bacterium]TDJ42741.1 MAG: hypothetical protein E2O54_01675 [Gammaproteobacteria bacterium]